MIRVALSSSVNIVLISMNYQSIILYFLTVKIEHLKYYIGEHLQYRFILVYGRMKCICNVMIHFYAPRYTIHIFAMHFIQYQALIPSPEFNSAAAFYSKSATNRCFSLIRLNLNLSWSSNWTPSDRRQLVTATFTT